MAGVGRGSCVLSLVIVESVTLRIDNGQCWSCMSFLNYPN